MTCPNYEHDKKSGRVRAVCRTSFNVNGDQMGLLYECDWDTLRFYQERHESNVRLVNDDLLALAKIECKSRYGPGTLETDTIEDGGNYVYRLENAQCPN